MKTLQSIVDRCPRTTYTISGGDHFIGVIYDFTGRNKTSQLLWMQRNLHVADADDVVLHALQTAQPWTDGDPIGVRNPVSVERTHLRVTTMANLLVAKAFNSAHGTPAVDLFEMGRVHLPQPEIERA